MPCLLLKHHVKDLNYCYNLINTSIFQPFNYHKMSMEGILTIKYPEILVCLCVVCAMFTCAGRHQVSSFWFWCLIMCVHMWVEVQRHGILWSWSGCWEQNSSLLQELLPWANFSGPTSLLFDYSLHNIRRQDLSFEPRVAIQLIKLICLLQGSCVYLLSTEIKTGLPFLSGIYVGAWTLVFTLCSSLPSIYLSPIPISLPQESYWVKLLNYLLTCFTWKPSLCKSFILLGLAFLKKS